MLKRIWNWWKPIAEKIGNFQARIILSVFYFIFVTPIALGVKLFSDPLRMKKINQGSWWIPRDAREDSVEEAEKQF
jgi:hypothetical protein